MDLEKNVEGVGGSPLKKARITDYNMKDMMLF
jgi:hypothetical protein